MMTRFNYFLFLILTGFLTSCVSKPTRIAGPLQAQWETKALITNQKDNKRHSLNIDIYAIRDQKTRLEISALLGFQMASLVMSPEEIAFVVYPKKTYYFGKNSESAFSRIIDLPLHPMNLTNIAFDQPIIGPGWKCNLDQNKLVSQCENVERKITVNWQDRDAGKKKVQIVAPQFEMQWLFSAPQTEVVLKNDQFKLKPPSGFKVIQIN